jgi:hypothetical protein
MGNELVDLVLVHGRQEGLFAVELASLRSRYLNTDFRSPAWLPLYEIERRGWDRDPAFVKIRTQDDPDHYYDTLRNRGGEFYVTGRDGFVVAAFDGWNLTERDFQVRQFEPDAFDDLIWADGRDQENYE